MSSVIWTVPGSAVCSMRAATFTASPIAEYSCLSSEPTSPTTTAPVLMPTRTFRSSPRSRATFSRSAAIEETISSPAITARCGSSSWAVGAPKNARIASPMRRATVPSCRTTGSMRCANASFMTSVQSSGSSSSAIAVEPRTSQKSIVTTRRSPDPAAMGPAPETLSRSPQALQNLAPSGLSAPHAPQRVMGRTITPHPASISGASRITTLDGKVSLVGRPRVG